jgi:hypothetical protein
VEAEKKEFHYYNEIVNQKNVVIIPEVEKQYLVHRTIIVATML